MLILLGVIMFGMAGIILFKMASDAVRGRPVMTARNFLLLGVINMQLTSAGIHHLTGNYGEIAPQSPEVAGTVFLVIITLFLTLFTWVYKRGWGASWLGRVGMKNLPQPNETTLMVLAFVLLGLAFILRVVFSQIGFLPGFLALLSTMLGPALAAAAAGCACWAWSRKMLNPAFLALMLAVVGGAFLIAIYRNFGRRDATSVMLACVWAGYHGGLKHIDWKKAFLPLAGLGAGAMVIISALTSTRSNQSTEIGAGEAASRMLGANLVYGFIAMASGQEAAPISMWLIEKRPDPVPYDTLHSLRYAVFMPIPRVWWEEYITSVRKPDALGSTMVSEAGVTRKAAGYNVGPGLVGHIWQDNPWLALPIYAFLLAALVRVLDNRVWSMPDNPFAVIPCGVALGEIVAIPRGELGLFCFRTVLASVGVMITMKVSARLLAGLGVPIRGERPVEDFDPEAEAIYVYGEEE
jgi:hypothetical protein